MQKPDGIRDKGILCVWIMVEKMHAIQELSCLLIKEIVESSCYGLPRMHTS